LFDCETTGATTVIWTPEAKAAIDELKTKNRWFICAACEWIAETNGAAEVTSEHVATVLAWMASTAVDLAGNKT